MDFPNSNVRPTGPPPRALLPLPPGEAHFPGPHSPPFRHFNPMQPPPPHIFPNPNRYAWQPNPAFNMGYGPHNVPGNYQPHQPFPRYGYNQLNVETGPFIPHAPPSPVTPPIPYHATPRFQHSPNLNYQGPVSPLFRSSSPPSASREVVQPSLQTNPSRSPSRERYWAVTQTRSRSPSMERFQSRLQSRRSRSRSRSRDRSSSRGSYRHVSRSRRSRSSSRERHQSRFQSRRSRSRSREHHRAISRSRRSRSRSRSPSRLPYQYRHRNRSSRSSSRERGRSHSKNRPRSPPSYKPSNTQRKSDATLSPKIKVKTVSTHPPSRSKSPSNEVRLPKSDSSSTAKQAPASKPAAKDAASTLSASTPVASSTTKIKTPIKSQKPSTSRTHFERSPNFTSSSQTQNSSEGNISKDGDLATPKSAPKPTLVTSSDASKSSESTTTSNASDNPPPKSTELLAQQAPAETHPIASSTTSATEVSKTTPTTTNTAASLSNSNQSVSALVTSGGMSSFNQVQSVPRQSSPPQLPASTTSTDNDQSSSAESTPSVQPVTSNLANVLAPVPTKAQPVAEKSKTFSPLILVNNSVPVAANKAAAQAITMKFATLPPNTEATGDPPNSLNPGNSQTRCLPVDRMAKRISELMHVRAETQKQQPIVPAKAVDLSQSSSSAQKDKANENAQLPSNKKALSTSRPKTTASPHSQVNSPNRQSNESELLQNQNKKKANEMSVKQTNQSSSSNSGNLANQPTQQASTADLQQSKSTHPVTATQKPPSPESSTSLSSNRLVPSSASTQPNVTLPKNSSAVTKLSESQSKGQSTEKSLETSKQSKSNTASSSDGNQKAPQTPQTFLKKSPLPKSSVLPPTCSQPGSASDENSSTKSLPSTSRPLSTVNLSQPSSDSSEVTRSSLDSQIKLPKKQSSLANLPKHHKGPQAIDMSLKATRRSNSSTEDNRVSQTTPAPLQSQTGKRALESTSNKGDSQAKLSKIQTVVTTLPTTQCKKQSKAKSTDKTSKAPIPAHSSKSLITKDDKEKKQTQKEQPSSAEPPLPTRRLSSTPAESQTSSRSLATTSSSSASQATPVPTLPKSLSKRPFDSIDKTSKTSIQSSKSVTKHDKEKEKAQKKQLSSSKSHLLKGRPVSTTSPSQTGVRTLESASSKNDSPAKVFKSPTLVTTLPKTKSKSTDKTDKTPIQAQSSKSATKQDREKAQTCKKQRSSAESPSSSSCPAPTPSQTSSHPLKATSDIKGSQTKLPTKRIADATLPESQCKRQSKSADNANKTPIQVQSSKSATKHDREKEQVKPKQPFSSKSPLVTGHPSSSRLELEFNSSSSAANANSKNSLLNPALPKNRVSNNTLSKFESKGQPRDKSPKIPKKGSTSEGNTKVQSDQQTSQRELPPSMNPALEPTPSQLVPTPCVTTNKKSLPPTDASKQHCKRQSIDLHKEPAKPSEKVGSVAETEQRANQPTPVGKSHTSPFPLLSSSLSQKNSQSLEMPASNSSSKSKLPEKPSEVTNLPKKQHKTADMLHKTTNQTSNENRKHQQAQGAFSGESNKESLLSSNRSPSVPPEPQASPCFSACNDSPMKHNEQTKSANHQNSQTKTDSSNKRKLTECQNSVLIQSPHGSIPSQGPASSTPSQSNLSQGAISQKPANKSTETPAQSKVSNSSLGNGKSAGKAPLASNEKLNFSTGLKLLSPQSDVQPKSSSPESPERRNSIKLKLRSSDDGYRIVLNESADTQQSRSISDEDKASLKTQLVSRSQSNPPKSSNLLSGPSNSQNSSRFVADSPALSRLSKLPFKRPSDSTVPEIIDHSQPSTSSGIKGIENLQATADTDNEKPPLESIQGQLAPANVPKRRGKRPRIDWQAVENLIVSGPRKRKTMSYSETESSVDDPKEANKSPARRHSNAASTNSAKDSSATAAKPKVPRVFKTIAKNRALIQNYQQQLKYNPNLAPPTLYEIYAFRRKYYTCIHCHETTVKLFMPEEEGDRAAAKAKARKRTRKMNDEDRKHHEPTPQDRLNADRCVEEHNALLAARYEATNRIFSSTGEALINDELERIANLDMPAVQALIDHHIGHINFAAQTIQDGLESADWTFRMPEPSVYTRKQEMMNPDKATSALFEPDGPLYTKDEHESHCFHCHKPIGDSPAYYCHCCFRVWHQNDESCSSERSRCFNIPNCNPQDGGFPDGIFQFRPIASNPYQCGVCHTEEYGGQFALTFGSHSEGYRKATPLKAVHYLVALHLLSINTTIKHQAHECMWRIDYPKALAGREDVKIGRRIDLRTIWRNKSKYKCTEALDCDFELLIHNVKVLFPENATWKTHIQWLKRSYPKQLEFIARCESCYCKSWEIPNNSDGFIQACETPHALVWAWLKRISMWWPAKAFEYREKGSFAIATSCFKVICFGDYYKREEHDPLVCDEFDLRLFSKKPPPPKLPMKHLKVNQNLKLKIAYRHAIGEINEYIKNLDIHYRYPEIPDEAEPFQYYDLYNQYTVPRFWFRSRVLPSELALKKLQRAEKKGKLPADFDEMNSVQFNEYLQTLLSQNQVPADNN